MSHCCSPTFWGDGRNEGDLEWHLDNSGWVSNCCWLYCNCSSILGILNYFLFLCLDGNIRPLLVVSMVDISGAVVFSVSGLWVFGWFVVVMFLYILDCYYGYYGICWRIFSVILLVGFLRRIERLVVHPNEAYFFAGYLSSYYYHPKTGIAVSCGGILSLPNILLCGIILNFNYFPISNLCFDGEIYCFSYWKTYGGKDLIVCTLNYYVMISEIGFTLVLFHFYFFSHYSYYCYFANTIFCHRLPVCFLSFLQRMLLWIGFIFDRKTETYCYILLFLFWMLVYSISRMLLGSLYFVCSGDNWLLCFLYLCFVALLSSSEPMVSFKDSITYFLYQHVGSLVGYIYMAFMCLVLGVL